MEWDGSGAPITRLPKDRAEIWPGAVERPGPSLSEPHSQAYVGSDLGRSKPSESMHYLCNYQALMDYDMKERNLIYFYSSTLS